MNSKWTTLCAKGMLNFHLSLHQIHLNDNVARKCFGGLYAVSSLVSSHVLLLAWFFLSSGGVLCVGLIYLNLPMCVLLAFGSNSAESETNVDI